MLRTRKMDDEMTQSSHTPTPLFVERQTLFGNTNGIQGINVYIDGMYIGSYTGGTDLTNAIEQKAAFIVRAVNNHEKLVRMLEAVLNTAETYKLSKRDFIDARELLAAAKGAT